MKGYTKLIGEKGNIHMENIQDLVARVISGDMQAFEAIRGMYGVPGRHGKISSVCSARQDQAGRAGL